MARQRKTARAVYTSDILKFGMENGFAASLESLLRHGVDTVAAEPDIIRAVARFLQAGKSDVELRWRREGTRLVEEMHEKRVIFTGYEWFSYKIPGGSYTADFSYLLENGHWVVVEIKGSRAQGSYRDSHTRLKAAASLNPWHTFYEVVWERRTGWDVKHIPPDAEFVEAFLQTLPQ